MLKTKYKKIQHKKKKKKIKKYQAKEYGRQKKISGVGVMYLCMYCQ